MANKFLEAVTHSGPSYETPVPVQATSTRRPGFLQALTHSGPSYQVADATTVKARQDTRNQTLKYLRDLNQEQRKTLDEAQAYFNRMERCANPEDKRRYLQLSADSFDKLAQSLDTDTLIAVSTLRSTLGPLDFLLTFMLRGVEASTGRVANSARKLSSRLRDDEEIILANNGAALEMREIRAGVSSNRRRIHRVAHIVP